MKLRWRERDRKSEINLYVYIYLFRKLLQKQISIWHFKKPLVLLIHPHIFSSLLLSSPPHSPFNSFVLFFFLPFTTLRSIYPSSEDPLFLPSPWLTTYPLWLLRMTNPELKLKNLYPSVWKKKWSVFFLSLGYLTRDHYLETIYPQISIFLIVE